MNGEAHLADEYGERGVDYDCEGNELPLCHVSAIPLLLIVWQRLAHKCFKNYIIILKN